MRKFLVVLAISLAALVTGCAGKTEQSASAFEVASKYQQESSTGNFRTACELMARYAWGTRGGNSVQDCVFYLSFLGVFPAGPIDPVSEKVLPDGSVTFEAQNVLAGGEVWIIKVQLVPQFDGNQVYRVVDLVSVLS